MRSRCEGRGGCFWAAFLISPSSSVPLSLCGEYERASKLRARPLARGEALWCEGRWYSPQRHSAGFARSPRARVLYAGGVTDISRWQARMRAATGSEMRNPSDPERGRGEVPARLPACVALADL